MKVRILNDNMLRTWWYGAHIDHIFNVDSSKSSGDDEYLLTTEECLKLSPDKENPFAYSIMKIDCAVVPEDSPIDSSGSGSGSVAESVSNLCTAIVNLQLALHGFKDDMRGLVKKYGIQDNESSDLLPPEKCEQCCAYNVCRFTVVLGDDDCKRTQGKIKDLLKLYIKEK